MAKWSLGIIANSHRLQSSRDIMLCVGLYQSSWLRRWPFDTLVERDNRARQSGPGEAVEHWRGQAGEVDLDDLLGAEELVEAAAKMTARFDHDRAGPTDIKSHHLEKDRVGALHPVRDDDDRNPADP